MLLSRAVAVAGALVLVAACSGGDDSASTSSTTSGAGTTPSETPVAGGTLRLGVARLPSLDPADSAPGSPSSSILADLLYDGLTTVAPGEAVASPALAASWSTPDGGVTWRFLLRPGAAFADGTPVAAADVEASLDHVAARGAGSLPAARLDVVADVVAVDPATVDVVLRRPMASLPELLAAPAYGVVPASALAAGDATAAATASSGPFRFAGVEGDVVRLARPPGGTALLDGVELRQHDDLGVAYDAFERGELDWTLVPPGRAEAVAEAHGSEGFVPFQAELFFGFNLADPAFADVRFRRAIVSAVDRDAVVEAVYFGFADPLTTVVPAGVPGHDPGRCLAGCAYDPDVARALLAEAFPPPAVVPTVRIDHEDLPDERALAQAVAEELGAVGIPAELRPHPVAEFAAFAVSGQQAMARLGWVGGHTTADAYLDPLFRTGAPDNATGLSDPAVDAALDAASRALDPAERERLLGAAEGTILGAAAVLPIAQFKLLSVSSERVRGLVVGVGGTFPAEAVWLAD